jgi:tetratricopeptide (TPR) repeat protein
LDGENTGFNDKLDETPPSTSVVAPEEILEQMIVEQTLEEGETESIPLEAVNEAADETGQPEVELAVMNIVTPVETVDEPIALGPNMAMVIEESMTEEDAALSLDEVNTQESTNETTVAEEESPLVLHEKKFNLVQVVEDVIAKVERAYAEQKLTAANEEQVAEEVSAATELSVASEESAQEVETVNAISEETVQEVEPIAETNEEVAFEVNSLAEVHEEIACVVETPLMSENVSLEEVEAPLASDETAREAESVAAELNEKAESEVETPVATEVSTEEQVSEDAPRRIPAWLVIKDTVKAEEKISIAETEAQPEPAQIESVTTLSDISQETAISESVVNMDVVETYTDPLAARLTTEPSLSEESIPGETADQVEGHVEREAVVEAQEMIAVEESNPVEESAVAEESSTVAMEEQVAELAYEEYLKDMAAPASPLTDHVDEIQGEAPVTKVSKNGEVRIAMDTKNAHVWNELGNIYLNAGTCDDAIASYSKAIELDRHFAWPYSNLALAYVQKGRFAEAILLYQRGIELFTSDRDKAITWNRLGNVYRRINDYSNAIASYQTADELDPENATLSLRSSFGLLGNMYPDSKPAYVA